MKIHLTIERPFSLIKSKPFAIFITKCTSNVLQIATINLIVSSFKVIKKKIQTNKSNNFRA